MKLPAVVLALTAMAAPTFALSRSDAVHLLVRTGFDAPSQSIQALSGLTRNEAVEKIVDQAAAAVTSYSVPPPAWARSMPDLLRARSVKGMSPSSAEAARRAYQQQLHERSVELQAWSMEQMIHSPAPFAERMVLFWHNNFTSSLSKVRYPGLLFNQDRLLRRYAFGSFAAMLHAVARDPAMIIYLDNETNSKGKPNENFAREVMELFTLGVGHYTEQDVKQSARAFTGWRVDFRKAAFRFDERDHDNGRKTFLGRTGNWNGDDILDIILDQKGVASFIVEKLWREFVSPTPDPTTVARLAGDFRRSGYAIKPLLIELLESDAFWSPSNRDTLVKSPVQLIVGGVRALGIEPVDPLLLVRASASLGQDLFDPRTVKGWPTGVGWIDSETLIRRHQVLSRLIAAYSDGLRKQLLAPSYQVE